MKANTPILIASLLLSSTCYTTTLANTPKKISDHHKTTTTQQAKMQSCKQDQKKCFIHSRFQIGPYLNKDRLFDGSMLLINTPTVREDARLLLQQYQLRQDCAALGIPLPKFPRLTVSGKIEGLFTYTRPYLGKNYSDFSIDSAELDLFMQATSWLSGYIALDYDPMRSNEAGSIFMNRGFVVLGNLAATPVYVSAGKMYVPFGRYSSNMITSPSTLALGRTRANAAVLGYQQTGTNAFYAQAYLYEGETFYSQDKQRHHLEGGAALGYNYNLGIVSGELGGGILSNLADSQGFHSLFNNGFTFIQHRIPAADLYGSFAYKQFNVIAEYIAALREFSVVQNNQPYITYNSQGAKPAAFNTEVSYNFKTFTKPSSVAIGYSYAKEAAALALPQNSYRAVYNINIWRNTNLAIQYQYDVNYDSDTAKGTSGSSATFGKNQSTLLAAFDFFF